MAYEDLAEILSRVNPLEIFSEHVSLRQTGKTWKGLCPFHNEKTASFHVNPEQGLWYCFGCGAGGNLFQFLMKINTLTFPEAKEILAKKAGIALASSSNQHQRKRERLYDLLRTASEYYQNILRQNPEGEEGLRYLSFRSVTRNSIEKFQLGMAPSSSQSLISFLSRRNFLLEEIQETGLAAKTNPPRDLFQKRILFPIWDSAERVIAFGGRSLGEEKPKYLNSPETPLFRKSEILYAFPLAKKKILKENAALIAEGYLDAVMLHQFGFENTIATLGTSFTFQQANFLRRFVSRAVLCYDGDSAGFTAMQRAFPILDRVGLELAFAVIPPGEDPDSFLKKKGSGAFQTLLETALSSIDFLLKTAKQAHNSETPEGKKKIADDLLPVLQSVTHPVLKEAYVKKVADSLGISESSLLRLSRGKGKEEPVESKTSLSREDEILRWILWAPHLAGKVWTRLTPENFEGTEASQGAAALHRAWMEKKSAIGELEEVSENTFSYLGRLSSEAPVGIPETLDSLLQAQQTQNLKKELGTTRKVLSSRLKEKEGEVDSTDEAHRKYMEILRAIKASKSGSIRR